MLAARPLGALLAGSVVAAALSFGEHFLFSRQQYNNVYSFLTVFPVRLGFIHTKSILITNSVARLQYMADTIAAGERRECIHPSIAAGERRECIHQPNQ
jgi:hypothetical protein